MNKVVLGIGHTLTAPGAKNEDGLYEQPFNFHVAQLVKKYLLDKYKIEIEIRVRIEEDYNLFCRRVSQSLFQRCENFYELHFNASQYPAKGAEVLCLRDSLGEANAKALGNTFKKAGWETRGPNGAYSIGVSDRGYELLSGLEASKVAAVIVEPCFGSNKLDPNYTRTFFNDGKGYANLLAEFLKERHYGN
jgi:N-acetylmuramoyl-L-alanine amidase